LTNICEGLTHINLDFSSLQKSQDQDSGPQDFFKALAKNTSTKTLQLSFQESNFASETDLNELSNLISNHYPSLKSLKLSFENCEQATESVVQNLFSKIGKVKNIDLNFIHCPQFTEETMKKLNHIFSYKTSFQSLALKFGHSNAITCSWLEKFSSSLEKSRILKLSLHFESCPQIQYWGVDHLLSGIGRIECLKELSLSFVDCKNLYCVKVFKNLSKCVDKLVDLKVLSLCMKGCLEFNGNDMEIFRKEVKSIIPIVQLDCSS